VQRAKRANPRIATQKGFQPALRDDSFKGESHVRLLHEPPLSIVFSTRRIEGLTPFLTQFVRSAQKKNFLDALSNSVRPFDYMVKAGQPAPPQRLKIKDRYRRKNMPQYLVANYLPDDFDPSAVTEAMIEEIHALNREMIAAGVRKFACGISPASNAKTVRKQPDGSVLVTDGPYTETKEHMGGFWILEAADMDEALAWARKGAISCDAAGEVRELLFYPAPEEATE
jgi:hypothetical protein